MEMNREGGEKNSIARHNENFNESSAVTLSYKSSIVCKFSSEMIDLNRAGGLKIITKKKWSQISKIIYTKNFSVFRVRRDGFW